MAWIHLADQIGAIRFLLAHEQARGAFNLIAPTPTSNAEFMRTLAGILHRPYWFPTPKVLLRMVLGEMSMLVVEGRSSWPKRLMELGYQFQFPTIGQALRDLFSEND
jgi:NAD dependent epimerase/dehydratase family enzyme